MDARWVSEHLNFSRTGDLAAGFLLPPRQNDAGVEQAVRNLARLAEAVRRPVAIENPVNYLAPRADEIPDGEFIAAVCERADCGLLLDLHNVYTNARNGRQTTEAFLGSLPMERVWEVHVAGGFEHEGLWLDAHSGPVEPEVLELLGLLLPRLKNLQSVIFEVFPSFIDSMGLDAIVDGLVELREICGRSPQHGAADKIVPEADPAIVAHEVGDPTPVALGGSLDLRGAQP